MARQRLTDRSIKRNPPASGQIEIWDSVVPGFGLRISYGGKRTYCLMTRINGRQVRLTVGTTATHTLADAREAARDMLRDAAKGVDPKEREAQVRREAVRARRDTFGAIAKDFMDERTGHLRSRDEYQRKLNKDILPEWRDIPISDLRRGDIKALVKKKAQTSPIAANRLLALIRCVFDYALDEELIDANLASRIKPEPENPRDRFLTAGEIKSFWRTLGNGANMDLATRQCLKFLLVTGQRRAEPALARWDEFDLEKKEWLIPAERTKNGLPHIVPLSDLACELLDEIADGGDYVFPGSVRGQPLTPYSVSQAMKRALPAMKLKGGRATPHDLRRTMVTHMNEDLGIEPHVVEAVVNHVSGAAKAGVAGVYNRALYLSQRRIALDAWGERIKEIVSGKAAPSNVVDLRPGA